MPAFPSTSGSVREIRGSVFTALAAKLRAFPGEVFPFHVGDTWLAPPEGSRMENLSERSDPGMHRYSQPEGLPRLADLLVERSVARTGIEARRQSVLVTTGATGGLGAIVGALVEPGDEVILLAPYWPLIEGIVRAFHGVPVDVPIADAEAAEAVVAALESAIGDRTVAVYLNTPNNPTGRTLPRAWLEAIATLAIARNLWIIADEVYEDLVYRGEHVYTRSLAPEHTFSAHSFSKCWAMAGNRCGWVVGPDTAMTELRKVGTHSFYAAPTASQLAACRLLEDPAAEAWIESTRSLYRELGDEAAAALGVPPPGGGTFLFFDTADYLDERGLEGFLLDCAERGIFLAPGSSFGPYPTHARMCFTAAPPDVTRRGVAQMARLLGR
ncbi:MAG: pyridoxal phosphate-dependent aminotransferase [Thermoanaerobaculia bacterium]|nr:pyridoxal phosphate-dependent aminotransferase [Thermoanaerobaculia bacterium]